MENDIMRALLKSVRLNLKNLVQFSHVLVVLGNETCDLDSAVSSLVFSLLLHHMKSNNSIAIPVFNIPRNQLPVKTEVTYFLRKHKMDEGDIVCRDEIDLFSIQKQGSLQLTLVDHHVLQEPDCQLVPSVRTVIDHRPQDPNWTWQGVDLTLVTVSSCCTLVAQKLLTQTPHLVTPSVASLLLGTILLDSACLSPEAGRATPLDLEIADQLQDLCGHSVDREQLFKELRNAKSDISSLTTAQLLIKDLKKASGIPIAGLPMKVQEFLKRADVSSVMDQFCDEHQTKVCVLYGSAVEGSTITRDLAVFSKLHPQAVTQIVDALVSSKNPMLNLQPQPCSVEGFALFEQLNIQATRKQILPIVRQVGENLQR